MKSMLLSRLIFILSLKSLDKMNLRSLTNNVLGFSSTILLGFCISDSSERILNLLRRKENSES